MLITESDSYRLLLEGHVPEPHKGATVRHTGTTSREVTQADISGERFTTAFTDFLLPVVVSQQEKK